MIHSDREIKANNMKLKQLRQQLDSYGRELDMISNDDPLLTEKSENIKAKMYEVWEKIKYTKKF